MKTYKNKNGEVNKFALNYLSSVYRKNNGWSKLSDYYSSRSTNYHSILHCDLFEMTEDKEIIKGSGFSALTKCIIRINLANADAAKWVADYENKIAEEKKWAQESENKFLENVKIAKEFVKQNFDKLPSNNPKELAYYANSIGVRGLDATVFRCALKP